MPDQVVSAHAHVVRLGEGDDLVARAEVVRPVGRLGGVPLHLVARVTMSNWVPAMFVIVAFDTMFPVTSVPM